MDKPHPKSDKEIVETEKASARVDEKPVDAAPAKHAPKHFPAIVEPEPTVKIKSVHPHPIAGLLQSQVITIDGENFTSQTQITLTGPEGVTTFDPPSMVPTQIILSRIFTEKDAGMWTIAVGDSRPVSFIVKPVAQ